jgi:AbrB family looped-hinge helix DNA binding protein
MNSIIRLDTRGRLVIPTEFRETLDLKEGDEILLSLDTKTNTLTISLIYGEKSNLVKIEIEFSDATGSLAKIAEAIATLNIDLIMSESKSYQRGKNARWFIIADISKCPSKIEKIKHTLLQNSSVRSLSITKIAHDRLHC